MTFFWQVSTTLIIYVGFKPITDTIPAFPADDCKHNFVIEPRIYGGHATTTGWPWIVRLEYTNAGHVRNLCGGTIVAENIILTGIKG